MKRIMKATAVVLATLAVLFILWQFRLVLLLFVLSIFVAAAVRPLVEKLIARGWPSGLAHVVLYGLGVAFLLLLIAALGEPFGQEVNGVANRAVVAYEGLYHSWSAGPAWQQTAVAMLPEPLTVANVRAAPGDQILPLLQQLGVGAMGLLSVLAGSLVVLAASIYWSIDQNRFERLWLSVLPVTWRTMARDSWREIEGNVGGYLRSQLAQSLLTALLLGSGAAAAGFDFPLLLALFAAVAAFLPLFFGGLLTAVFAFALGMIQNPGAAWGMAAYTVFIYATLDVFVEPHLWARKRRSLLLTILVIVPLVQEFGLWGMAFAPLLAAILSVLTVQAYRAVTKQRATAMRFADLQSRFERLEQEVTAAENGAVTPELRDMTGRLGGLLDKTEVVSP